MTTPGDTPIGKRNFAAVAELRRNLDRPEPTDQGEEPAPRRLGDFRIVRQIAHGGMGTIYEAIQEPLGRRVAVKTVLGHNMHLASAARERFLREQKVLAQLHHTHIVPIHAAGSEGPLQYFAMSYIDGAALHHVVRTARRHELSSHGSHAHTPTPTLAELAAEAKSSTLSGESPDRNGTSGNGQHPAAESTTAKLPLVEPPCLEPPAEDVAAPTHSENGNGKLVLSPEYFRSVARVMLDAAEAVHHAHEAGIIHRDLKPSNLMVDTAEHCWVLDFGLAGYLRAEGREETTTAVATESDLGPEPQQPLVSAVLGTPHYMAPEQFQRKADARTDVWGLGVTLYELLTLSRAFHSREQIESADPPRPSKLVHGVPPDLEAICWKALRKRPGPTLSVGPRAGRRLAALAQERAGASPAGAHLATGWPLGQAEQGLGGGNRCRSACACSTQPGRHSFQQGAGGRLSRCGPRCAAGDSNTASARHRSSKCSASG